MITATEIMRIGYYSSFCRSPLGFLRAWQTKLINTCAVIFVTDLYPASLKHKNPQRHKIIHGMRATQRSIDRSEHLYL